MNLKQDYTIHLKRLQLGYEEALSQSGFDAVILHSGKAGHQRLVDDQHWPLKVSPSFSQWIPLQSEDTYVVIEGGKKPTLIRPIRNNFWEGPPPEPVDFFVDHFNLIKCAEDKVLEALPKGKRVAWIGESVARAKSLQVPTEGQNPAALVQDLDALRVTKSNYEIRCLAKANALAMEGHRHVEALFMSGDYSELQLHLEYLKVTQQDATDTPYGNIVALGRNAAVLHHLHYTKNKDERTDISLLVDAGVSYLGYGSDITRTYVRGNSAASKDFAALIKAMHALELSLCTQAEAGLDYQELHNRSHQGLAGILIESGLCLGKSEALVEQGITRAFFPHGLGHSLGLQVHDVGCRLIEPSDNNPYLRNTSTIAEGQVFTIEPGCYFIDNFLNPLREGKSSQLIGWKTLDALHPFGGIRIEDNLAITSTDCVNLTRDGWPD